MMTTKIKVVKGEDEMHAFLELVLAGVQANMNETRRAMNINCEEAMPTALEWVARDAKVAGDFLERAKDGWYEAGDDDAGEAVVELDVHERNEVLRVMKLGIGSLLEAALRDAEVGSYSKAANKLQDLGQAMVAASAVFRGMEIVREKGGEA